MPASRKAAPARVRFERWVHPADRDGYPHYDEIARANAAYEAAYARELKRRRREREARAKSANPAAWRRHADEVRRALAKGLGVAYASAREPRGRAEYVSAVPLHADGARGGTLAWMARLNARRYACRGLAWDGGDVELLELRPQGAKDPLSAALVLPDAGLGLMGAESPEGAARGWGEALVRAGFLAGIPALPGLANFSSTRNKRRILEGSCALGEVLGEAAAALGALLQRPGVAGVAGGRAWVAGRGVGALLALLLGALDDRVAGVLADAPPAWGELHEALALIVPFAHEAADLPELAALLAPRPLALVQPVARRSAFDPPAANLAAVRRGARPAYAKARAASALKSFGAGQLERAAAWAAARKPGSGAPEKRLVRAEIPFRRFNVNRYRSAAAWKRDAPTLRRLYRKAMGLPAASKPLSVKFVGFKRLPDALRVEYLVQTGACTWANLTFLRPLGEVRPRTTILCLPGSGSDVKKVEDGYAHEVIAEGWNAAIIDARAALYPFFPGQSAGRALVAQGVHDILCAFDAVAKRPDVDPARIGSMGVSQGGTHSWMLGALEPRVAAIAPVCGICTYHSLHSGVRDERYDAAWLSFLDSHGIYYYPPGILALGDQQDFCALLAPRPFALIGANHDNCFPLEGMREAARDLRHIYKVVGAPGAFRYVEFEGPHSMPEHTRRTAYAFFRKHLG
ncbi:MAG: acetylxylan esterase [Planctomycetota bacterium]|nr:acetylxylan esterase [Planctomycetota bacterium]